LGVILFKYSYTQYPDLFGTVQTSSNYLYSYFFSAIPLISVISDAVL
jgi:hypothetical protein